VPEHGYTLVPRYFWTWDEPSATLINNWAEKTKVHKAMNMGTPWRNDYKALSIEKQPARNYLLMNMTDVVVEDFILQAVKLLDEKYRWVFRMHPRMGKERHRIEEQLAQYHIAHLVTVEDSRYVLLADSLRGSALFISNSSGSVIEAIQMGIRPVLLPSPGVNYYDHYVASGQVVLLNEKSGESLAALIEQYAASEDKIQTEGQTEKYENKFAEFERMIGQRKITL
jgi:UDP-N-acetylglucosamine 2-epimerase